MRRTRVVIQSRLNSSRLPGKAMMTVAGMPLIELVARRASRSGHEVVVATSEEPYDERIAHHLEQVGIPVVRGDLDDVLGRFVMATEGLDDSDRVVRLTGDNPLADADLVDELLAAMDESGHTYGRVDIDQAPEGIGCEGFTAGVLREAAATTDDPYDREHVTPWLRRALGELLFVPKDCPSDLRGFRATIDCLDDFDRVTRVFDGVEDPISVGWLPLMLRLQERLDDKGAVVPMGASGTFSRLVVGVAPLGRPASGGARPEATVARAILADAVTRGVTHMAGGVDDGDALAVARSASEPALAQRLGLVARLGRVVDGAAVPADQMALHAELALERLLATIGKRKVDTIVVDAGTPALGAVWSALRLARVATRLGVRLEDPSDLEVLDATPDVDLIEVTAHRGRDRWFEPDVERRLTSLRDSGVLLLASSVLAGGALVDEAAAGAAELAGTRESLAEAAARLGRPGVAALCIADALGAPWCDAVIVGCDDADQLRANADAACAEPLTAEERDSLRG
ncbi:cytidylyltransferase domain-containing protein [Actinomycetota bacterium]